MSEELKRRIGRTVQATRNRAELTQEQLAENIGRSVEAISNIERGISLPTIDTMERIAEAVSVPIGLFFEGTTNAKDANEEAAFELRVILTRLKARDAGLLLSLAKAMAE